MAAAIRLNIAERFVAVDQRFEAVDEKLTAIDGSIEAFSRRVDSEVDERHLLAEKNLNLVLTSLTRR